jgi:uncharacterized protein (TIGR02284 family)
MNTKIKTLVNELLETSRDGERGFRKSAEEVNDPTLKSVLRESSQHCAEAARELADELRKLGGDVEDDGSVAGSVHRGWVGFKSSVTGHDTAAILAETERGEDYAKQVYKEALEAELPPDLRFVIERQYRGVIANHDRVRDLRNAFRS